jgi:hypothetical protein
MDHPLFILHVLGCVRLERRACPLVERQSGTPPRRRSVRSATQRDGLVDYFQTCGVSNIIFFDNNFFVI